MGDKWGTRWKTSWETRRHPCRDKISPSTRRQSGGGRQAGRQDGIHVVTRSQGALGDTVGDTVRYGKIIS